MLQNSGSQRSVSESSGGLLKETVKLLPQEGKIYSSASEEWAWEFEFQTSFLVLLMLLVQGPPFKKPMYKPFNLECPVKTGYWKFHDII